MNLNCIKTSLKLISINDLINYLFIAYAFLVPLNKDGVRIIGVLLFLLWIIEGNFKNKFIILKTNRVIFMFFLFVIYNYISLFWTNEIELSINYVGAYFYYFPFVIMLTSLKKEYLPKLINVFLLAMFLSEIVNYGIYLDFWTTAHNELQEKLFGNELPRAFMGHSAYSLFLAFASLLLLNKFIYESSLKYKYLYLSFFVITFISLMVSGGRTGLLPFIITLFIYILFNIKRIKIKNIIIFLTLIISLLAISFSTIKVTNERFSQAKMDIQNIFEGEFNSSFGLRIALVELGIEVVKENPIFGVGIKENLVAALELSKTPEYKKYDYFSTWSKKDNYHNQYIEIATQLGLVGLTIFLLFLYYIAKIKISNSEYFNIKLIFVSMLIFGITTTGMFHHRFPIGLFALFIGILLVYSKYEKEDKTA